MWYRLEEKAGINRIRLVGWHSIRRTLNTELRKAVHPQTGVPVNPTSASLFMGWRGKHSNDMTDRYISMEYVGWGDAEVQQLLWRQDIDQKIFAVHPFLASWRQDGQNATSRTKKKDARKARGS